MARGLRKSVSGTRRWPLVIACAAVVLGAGGGSALAAAASGPPLVRVGASPAPARFARAVGALSSSVRMHVTVVLKARDPSALAAYARQVSTPGSSLYRAYLTPAEFGARFGPTTAELRAVQASMRAHGLTPGAPSANRLAVPVSGTAGAIERAFSLSFRRVVTSGGRVAILASAAPALDRGIAATVQAVVGLTTVSAPKPLLARTSRVVRKSSVASRPGVAPRPAGDSPQACPSASAAAASQGAHTANQIAAAYGFNGLYAAGAEGQGQTIAIYELESYDPNDIRAYQSCYGIGANVTSIPVDGGPGGGGPGSGEAALDVEQAVGLAPKATFLVYQGPNSGSNAPGSGPYDTLSAIISQDRARVVSISWGQCEVLQGSSVLGAESTLFEEAATQGQSIVGATGDNGSEDCNDANGSPDNELAVDDPGSQPFVTGVGGTTLVATGPPPSETVWNHAGPTSGPLAGQGGAGGGGVSRAWGMPGYQSNAAPWLNVIGPYSSGAGCANAAGHCRQVPDVAADADPASGYIIYWNGAGAAGGLPQGWQAVGGTSAGPPLWAALLADADSSPACHGTAIGFANPALYQAASSSYGSYFNDITTGNSDLTGANGGLYPAGSGYDMASGLGTPKAGALAAALCADSLRVNSPGTQTSTVGQPVSLRITTTAVPGSHLKFYASQLPPGLSISQSSGLVTGRPKRTGTWDAGIAALGQDLSLRAAYFRWDVVGPPKVSGLTISGVAAGHPRLGFTVTAGHGAPLLKAIAIRLSSGLSFAHLAGRILVTGAYGRRVTFVPRVAGGRLQLVLRATAAQVRISIRPGAISATRSLAADVQLHRSPAVAVTVTTLDSSGLGYSARERVRPRG